MRTQAQLNMKRKLDENDQPSEAHTPDAVEEKKDQAEPSFAEFGLDSRLVQAVAQQKFREPTQVQRKAIPLALEGKDLLVKSKTGSGKTAVYVLPVLQAILKRKQTDSRSFTSTLILVPTRELADQTTKVIEQFSAFCSKDIQVVKLTDKVSDAVQRSLLSNSPDIVISTPARAASNIAASALDTQNLAQLVLDESDLLLSYGYDEDLEAIARSLPKGVQTILMSATLCEEIDSLKGLFCRDPVLLDMKEREAEGEGVSQYVVKCGEDEKFLLSYVIFKLQLIKGKCIIFVADVDRCYRLKLFFEQFGIRSCVLNSELPVNSRIHVVEEFNRNIYDIIIASDENEVLGNEDQPAQSKDEDGEGDAVDVVDEEGAEDAANKSKEKQKKKGKGKDNQHEGRPKKKRKTRSDKEYGVSRGIDFKNVACVINFDMPTSAKSYLHRIGRTGRAGKTGMALSFIIPEELYRKHMPTTVETAKTDEAVLRRVVKEQAKKGKEVRPYNFDMKQVDAFRYRMNDALRAVTRVAIREARTRELRQELLKSEKLKRHFEENPAELHHLRHDGELRAARTQAHLKHVPEYLLPRDGKAGLSTQEVGFVPLNKPSDHKQRRSKYYKKGKSFGLKGRKSDPLKTFKAKRRTK